jgi:hypothetical protein
MTPMPIVTVLGVAAEPAARGPKNIEYLAGGVSGTNPLRVITSPTAATQAPCCPGAVTWTLWGAVA